MENHSFLSGHANWRLWFGRCNRGTCIEVNLQFFTDNHLTRLKVVVTLIVGGRNSLLEENIICINCQSTYRHYLAHFAVIDNCSTVYRSRKHLNPRLVYLIDVETDFLQTKHSIWIVSCSSMTRLWYVPSLLMLATPLLSFYPGELGLPGCLKESHYLLPTIASIGRVRSRCYFWT